MDWFNLSMSDSSDLCDSEIEFELYSQLHYSTGCTTEPTKHRIVPKQKLINSSNFNGRLTTDESFSSDTAARVSDRLSGLPEQCASNNESRSSRSPSLLSVYSSEDEDWQIITSSSDSEESDDHLGKEENDIWKVSSVDHEEMHQRIFRYYNKPKSRCSRCNRPGHSAFECNQPRKIQRCCMCGNKGHHPQTCKGSLYLGPCYKENKHCKRCDQTGHDKKHCPDKWRQFHLTVSPGRLIASKLPNRAVVKKACYHCFQFGHLSHDCESRWEHENHNFLSPTVFQYDKKLKINKGSAQNSLPTFKIKKVVGKLKLQDHRKCNKKLKSAEKILQTTKVKRKHKKKITEKMLIEDITSTSKDTETKVHSPYGKHSKNRASNKITKPVENLSLTFDKIETKLQWLNGKRKQRAFDVNAKRLKLEENIPQNEKLKNTTVLCSRQSMNSNSPFRFNFQEQSEIMKTDTNCFNSQSSDTTMFVKSQSEMVKARKSPKRLLQELKQETESWFDSDTDKKETTCIASSNDENKSLSNELTVESDNMFCNSKTERRKLHSKKKTVSSKPDLLNEDYLTTPFPRTNLCAKNRDKESRNSSLSTCLKVTIQNQSLNNELHSPANQCQELTLPCA